MPPTQGDSRGSKNLGTDATRRGRVSRGMILLGAALLACALALYWYASSNTPLTLSVPDNIDRINRATPATASPSNTPAPKEGARPAR